MWFIRSFRMRVHSHWLQQAVLSRSISSIGVEEYVLNPEKFNKVKFKPRGWTWVDPTKEVEAYERAVRDGFTTVGKVVSLSGGGDDLEDVLTEREQELKDMKAKNLVFDTDPAVVPAAKPKIPVNQQDQPAAKGGNNGDKSQF